MPMRVPSTVRPPALNSYLTAGTFFTVSGSPSNWWRRVSMPELKMRPVAGTQLFAWRSSISLLAMARASSATIGRKIKPIQKKSECANGKMA